MKTRIPALLLSLAIAATAHAADRPWQKLSNPSAADLAANLAEPPPEYSAQFDYGFSTNRTREAVAQQLDRAKALNVHAAFVEPTRGNAPYLSPAYFDAVKMLVEEAKKRNMRLWFDDDGGYPSGFAGGKYTTDRPDLRSMALTVQRTPVTAGQTFSEKIAADTICVLATNTDTGATHLLEPVAGAISWSVPPGHWEIVQPKGTFRSGPTRSANNSAGGKTAEHSLMDYLHPEANNLFVHWTFDGYKQAIGDELGKTVLGFRGDEPSFGFNPWSNVLLQEFQKRKGYDLRPYLGSVAAISMGRRAATAPITDDAHRAYADYCDVWSDLFGENFFGTEAKWCADNNVEMQMHIEHEENLPMLAVANGDFFKCLRSVQVPGIDAIWHQVWHDVVADFPKLASSAAHLNGHPRAMCEVFAAYNPVPDIKEAGWILNHLMVNGISRIEYMGMQGATPRNFYADPGFPALAAHVNRVTYLLGEGRPTAQIGVYIPSTSFWFNDTAADTAFKSIVHQLLENQRDLDFVDEYSLAKTLKLEGDTLINQSGQPYRAILVPPLTAISKPALDNLQAFAKAGGKVIFFASAPKLVMDKNFLTATGPANIQWATLQPTAEITAATLAALPTPDLHTDKPNTALRYNHRRLKDADLYFLFNESDQPLTTNTSLATTGATQSVEQWDTSTGKPAPQPATLSHNKITLPLDLPPWSTKLIVIKTQ